MDHGGGAGKKNHFTILYYHCDGPRGGGVAGKKNHFTILYYNCDGPREGGLVRRITLLYFTITVTGHGGGGW